VQELSTTTTDELTSMYLSRNLPEKWHKVEMPVQIFVLAKLSTVAIDICGITTSIPNKVYTKPHPHGKAN